MPGPSRAPLPPTGGTMYDRKTHCLSCGAEIVWLKTIAGRSIPCNAKKVAIVSDAGKVLFGRVSHFATCKDAESWRKKK